MACPKCGGTRRKALGRNYFLCEEQVAVPTRGWAPAPLPAFLGEMVPVDGVRHIACGHRYQEEPAMGDQLPTCGCGMFAIGVCRACQTPVCGHSECSDRVGGELLCVTHVAERRREDRERELERAAERKREEAEAVTRAVQEQETWEKAVLDELARMSNPVERLVRVVASVGQSDDRDLLLPRFIPELPWSRDPGPYDERHHFQDDDARRWHYILWRRPPWDHAAVAAWFVGAVGRQEPSSEIWVYDRKLTRGERGVSKKRNEGGRRGFVIPGWIFEHGSTTRFTNYYSSKEPSGYPQPTEAGHGTVSITSQGQVLNGGFNVKALIDMARIAGLCALPSRPS